MADTDESTDDSFTEQRTKVGGLIKEYEMVDLGAELERRWTAEGDDRMSLRELATYFNKRVLDARLAAADVQSLSIDVDNVYQMLTDEYAGSGDRTRLIRRLEREGIDTEALRADFVTYQAIRSYLQKVRDAEYKSDNGDRVESEAAHIRRLRGRLESVADQKIKHLRETDSITLGDFNLFVDVNVFCTECGQQFSVDELMDRRTCECGGQTLPADGN